jgi:arsenate reductase
MADHNVTIYGIPNCGTVKKTRAWLDERGVAHDFVDFRKSPVETRRIEAWVAALGSRALRNTSGGSYRALPDGKKEWDDATWVTHFADDPMLIKRPVIEVDGAPVMAGFRTPDVLRDALG